jgi:hypothetical protein
LACMIAAQIQPLPVVCRLAPGVDIPAALAWAVLRLDPSPPAPPASDNLISLLEGAFSFAIFTLLLLLSCVLPHGVLQVDRRFSPTFFKRSLAVLPSPNDRSVNVRERWDPPFRKVKSIHRHTTPRMDAVARVFYARKSIHRIIASSISEPATRLNFRCARAPSDSDCRRASFPLTATAALAPSKGRLGSSLDNHRLRYVFNRHKTQSRQPARHRTRRMRWRQQETRLRPRLSPRRKRHRCRRKSLSMRVFLDQSRPVVPPSFAPVGQTNAG